MLSLRRCLLHGQVQKDVVVVAVDVWPTAFEYICQVTRSAWFSIDAEFPERPFPHIVVILKAFAIGRQVSIDLSFFGRADSVTYSHNRLLAEFEKSLLRFLFLVIDFNNGGHLVDQLVAHLDCLRRLNLVVPLFESAGRQADFAALKRHVF